MKNRHIEKVFIQNNTDLLPIQPQYNIIDGYYSNSGDNIPRRQISHELAEQLAKPH